MKFEYVGYNPMRLLDPKSNLFNAMAEKIASGCVIRGSHKDTYWDDSALDLVKGIIMAEAILNPTAHLGRVAEIVAGNVPAFAKDVLSRTNNPTVRAALYRYLPKEKKEKKQK